MSERICTKLNDRDYEELQKLAHELDIEEQELVKRFILYVIYQVDDVDKIVNHYRWHRH